MHKCHLKNNNTSTSQQLSNVKSFHRDFLWVIHSTFFLILKLFFRAFDYHRQNFLNLFYIGVPAEVLQANASKPQHMKLKLGNILHSTINICNYTILIVSILPSAQLFLTSATGQNIATLPAGGARPPHAVMFTRGLSSSAVRAGHLAWLETMPPTGGSALRPRPYTPVKGTGLCGAILQGAGPTNTNTH